MLRPEYPIETERLTIRPFELEDFDQLYSYHSRPDVARYLYWDARNATEARAALDRKIGESTLTDEGRGLSLAVVWREVDRIVGDVSLRWLSRDNRQGEIG